jgi:hypothetical protein
MKNSTKKNFVPTNDAKYTQRRRRKCGRDRPPFDAFLKRERERSEREVISVLKMRENSPRRKDTMDKI